MKSAFKQEYTKENPLHISAEDIKLWKSQNMNPVLMKVIGKMRGQGIVVIDGWDN